MYMGKISQVKPPYPAHIYSFLQGEAVGYCPHTRDSTTPVFAGIWGGMSGSIRSRKVVNWDFSSQLTQQAAGCQSTFGWTDNFQFCK
jgi:hypothetical protein